MYYIIVLTSNIDKGGYLNVEKNHSWFNYWDWNYSS